ncbi:hypothetical protein BpHYR1_025796 [Brachionus plicatilis]|uniref:Uncharacterized protein n=1 Tax=Brachionus plicatilis TaxID=10195 RepID=A0A3M7P8A8_BRAPC|nr:hypothetical protein BpHYR1_025796 [Brachionus plicatilis]
MLFKTELQDHSNCLSMTETRGNTVNYWDKGDKNVIRSYYLFLDLLLNGRYKTFGINQYETLKYDYLFIT